MKDESEKTIVERLKEVEEILENYFKETWKRQDGYWCACYECILKRDQKDSLIGFICLCKNILGLDLLEVHNAFKKKTQIGLLDLGCEMKENTLTSDNLSEMLDEFRGFKQTSKRITAFFRERIILDYFEKEDDGIYFLDLFVRARKFEEELMASRRELERVYDVLSKAKKMRDAFENVCRMYKF